MTATTRQIARDLRALRRVAESVEVVSGAERLAELDRLAAYDRALTATHAAGAPYSGGLVDAVRWVAEQKRWHERRASGLNATIANTEAEVPLEWREDSLLATVRGLVERVRAAQALAADVMDERDGARWAARMMLEQRDEARVR